MNLEEFSMDLKQKAKMINIEMSEKIIEKFYNYMNLILEWNKKINLTAITDEKEIILKHFIDSITISKFIKEDDIVLDVGTGAGFPGIPLKIINDKTEFILTDSLNKRIKFLEIVKNNLNLEKIELMHYRAEDLGKNEKYREKETIVVSRAVANLRILSEYMIPFVKYGGICICMKGPNINEEVEEAKNAIKKLGGIIEKIENINLPNSNIERNIIIIRKIKDTPKQYPRKAGIPSKQPL